MKHLKKLALAGATVLAVGAISIPALAVSGYSSPADIVAGLTGNTVESVIADKTESGETYGSIASSSDVLSEFRAEMLEIKRANLAERVAAGAMTQERADEILAAMEAHQADCDGTGSGGNAGTGAGFGGFGAGTGTGTGSMNRGSHGNGQSGTGCGLGTCTGQTE
ncbi:hypothetical protein [Papillibacter cinnamivorans]|uniref:DUF2680 domain-containing protein n=1 Tax=Papillibacter cinnamivorans DSM 12816 TaxID=1122930 RepID=A0A1W2CNU4_9FIRM|nr:hypothetical protein [Papillibacter cinnamivorans]SMC86907.1 hypothetical protein SAMN02745168_0144 [Papillibacter cinnamivorans DSM 12816]